MNTLIQISDCHIDKNPNIMGVNTQDNLQKIICEITQHPYDALLITGDLSHHGTLESYKVLKTLLPKTHSNLLMISGNHDNTDNLIQIFALDLSPKFSLGNWEIISIDSTQVDKVSGYIPKQRLSQLEQNLKNTKASYNIIALHHPPVSMQSSWDDALSLENPQDLFQVIDKYPKIKAILWGHAHQSRYFTRNKVKLICCPSTAKQFNNEAKIGFNHYTLHDNGDLAYTTQWI